MAACLSLTLQSSFLAVAADATAENIPVYEGYKLVWHDEFSEDGELDPARWGYETGFVRNEELQWYRRENAFCLDGVLRLEARRERVRNPNYDVSASDWRTRRRAARAALHTPGT